MRGITMFLLLTVPLACSKDGMASADDESRIARQAQAELAKLGGQPTMRPHVAPASPKERALTQRLLAMLPEGDARDYVRASLAGETGVSSHLKLEGFSVEAQALVDSIYALRRAEDRARAESNNRSNEDTGRANR